MRLGALQKCGNPDTATLGCFYWISSGTLQKLDVDRIFGSDTCENISFLSVK